MAAEQKDSVTFYFQRGKSDFEPSLNHNSQALRHLDSISQSGRPIILDINISGAASPEGSVTLNNHLSDRRAEIIRDIISSKLNLSPTKTTSSFIGRDWRRLLDFARQDPEIPSQDETLSLLENIVYMIDQRGYEEESDHFLEKLKAIDNGVTYKYLFSKYFPLLRSSRVYFDYRLLPVLPLYPDSLPISVLTPSLSDIVVSTLPFEAKESRNFYMALKTNMLYDVLALPSLSAEFYLGKNFSAVGNWTYGWWDKNSTHRYWRAYGGDLAVRWWFGKKANEKPLTGHHLGIYGGIFTYDFEFGGKGYMGGLPHETLWNRSLRMAGIEYGYSLPIARRLNIDFTIGIGYMGGKYIKYIPDGGRYLWQSTNKLNWFGPTKAEISLVWLIGNGNYNQK
ncbi:MAG: DUF3575 domain-containing protein [Muribaculaceae bacterium]|nr:DUF3575 domain-containing protein [Muribaculaceae bacterium]